jgi:hypothetical protein
MRKLLVVVVLVVTTAVSAAARAAQTPNLSGYEKPSKEWGNGEPHPIRFADRVGHPREPRETPRGRSLSSNDGLTES